MRDLKFRAWDKKYCEWFGDSSDDCLTYVGFHIFGECLTFCPPSVSHLKHLIVEQYTGLKDKNDVEIYEGDIISNGHINLEVKYKTVNAFFWAVSKTHSVLGHKFKLFEIIGNIHENPELI